jgi:hypothetical protein
VETIDELKELSDVQPWLIDEFVRTINSVLPRFLSTNKGNEKIKDDINLRLIRHYTSQGMVDLPLRQGRCAVYNYRHLLQVLVVRKLLAQGIGANAINKLAIEKSNSELEELLTNTVELNVSGDRIQIVEGLEINVHSDFKFTLDNRDLLSKIDQALKHFQISSKPRKEIMSPQQRYKTLRGNINTSTLLDDVAPILIDDISQKFQPISQLKEDYCSQLEQNCSKLQKFSEFSAFIPTLREDIKKLKDDFSDCEENIDYFTLVIMGPVSAGKTSMICDLLNANPDQLNQALYSSKDFEEGSDNVVIAGEVATTNVYEFLVNSSGIRLVDNPGISGVVHDNTTLAPFVNKADCLIFLCNAQSDLTGDDYNFVVRHIVGLQDANELTPENASNKKALIVVNKWNTVARDLPRDKEEKQWQIKKDWILRGDSKKGKDGNFKGLSELFKRTLTIVRASTTQRVLDENSGTYDQYGQIELNEVIDALKEILLEEGIQIKLERPKIILKRSLSEVQKLLENERTKLSVDELIAKLEQIDIKVTIDSTSIKVLLNSRLENLQNRLKNDLFYQIKNGLDQWKPSVSVMDRIKGLWPKEWWGSDNFGAKAVQEELKYRWGTEIETLLQQSIKPDDIKRTVRDEADSIGKLLEATFKAQLAELQNQVIKTKLSTGFSLPSIDNSSFSLTSSIMALEEAANKAASEIQRSIIDDIIGLITVDAIIAGLIGAFLSPLGSVVFLAIRRFQVGKAEEKKAKREIEDGIWSIADEVSRKLQEKVANELRGSIERSVDSIAQVIDGERQSLSKSLQALDEAISTVKKIRERLETISE